MNDFFDRRQVISAAAAVPVMLAAVGADASPVLPAAARAFDFLHGRWAVRHRQLRHRLAGSHDWFEFDGTLEVNPILAGMGNFDRNELAHPAGAYEAHSLRLFDPVLRQWSIWWLDSRSPALDAPVVGGFSGAKGTFYSDDVFGSEPIRVRTTYEPLSPTTAQWTQAFSRDREATWEVNWVMDFRKQRP